MKGILLTKIAIIGSGYVGLSLGVCLAGAGYSVHLCDKNPERIETLKKGIPPFREPFLAQMLTASHLNFTTSLEEAVNQADICFLCLPTPTLSNGACDLSQIESLLDRLPPEIPIVIKSTVIPGTARRIANLLPTNQIISNPEFLQVGKAIENTLNPDRIILGYDDYETALKIQALYVDLSIDPGKILLMDFESAEMSKYAANVMLASRLATLGEIAKLCDKTGANIEDVKRSIALDPRIGQEYLETGIGYGGPCLSKDLRAIAFLENSPLLNEINQSNESMIAHFMQKIFSYFNTEDLSKKTFAVWGVTFKKDAEDTRESPALKIVKQLLAKGATIRIYEPMCTLFIDEITQFESATECLQTADALCLLTPHTSLPLNEIQNVPVVFDGRNLLLKQPTNMLPFDYFAVGGPNAQNRCKTEDRRETLFPSTSE